MPGWTILVLEDDENLQQIVADCLRDERFEVQVANSAEHAIALAKEHSFQLILSDVRMAGSLDGVEAVREIKRILPEVRSIVITGYADLEVPLRAAQVQADAYLLKPVQLHTLLNVVHQAQTRDASLPAQTLLTRLVQTREDLTQRLTQWLKSSQLQQFVDARGKFVHGFYILMMSKRLSPDESYAVYAQWLRIEEGCVKPDSSRWVELSKRFAELEQELLAIARAQTTRSSSTHANLVWNKFKSFNQNVQSGRVSLEQFDSSAQLLLDEDSRKANLKNYLTHQWLWNDHSELDQENLTGLQIGDYKLGAAQEESCRAAIAYQATNIKDGQQHLVFGFLDTAEHRQLAQEELRSRRVVPLGSHRGYLLLMYPKTNLWAAYRPEGLSPEEAWRLMRPVFRQVQEHHARGVCSGEFSFEHIQLLPGKEPQLTWFGQDLALERLERMERINLHPHRAMIFNSLFRIGCAQEIFRGSVSQPVPLSDQACLAAITVKLIAGDREKNSFWSLILFDPKEKPGIYGFEQLLLHLGELASPLQKMLNADLSQRFASVELAIQAMDAAGSMGKFSLERASRERV